MAKMIMRPQRSVFILSLDNHPNIGPWFCCSTSSISLLSTLTDCSLYISQQNLKIPIPQLTRWLCFLRTEPPMDPATLARMSDHTQIYQTFYSVSYLDVLDWLTPFQRALFDHVNSHQPVSLYGTITLQIVYDEPPRPLTLSSRFAELGNGSGQRLINQRSMSWYGRHKGWFAPAGPRQNGTRWRKTEQWTRYCIRRTIAKAVFCNSNS